MNEAKGKRRHARVKLPLLVQYRFSLGEEFQTDYSADLSRGGMFIYGDREHAVGSMLYIQFITRDGARVIRGQGRIVRSTSAEGAGERCGQAVEFLDFDENDIRFLEELVTRCLDEQQRAKARQSRRTSRATEPPSEVEDD